MQVLISLITVHPFFMTQAETAGTVREDNAAPVPGCTLYAVHGKFLLQLLCGKGLANTTTSS